MKRITHYIIFLCVILSAAHAQKIYRKSNPEATTLFNKGEALYDEGQYKTAADIISKAMRLEDGIITEYYYRAAMAWSMAGYYDSAFVMLNIIAPAYNDVNNIETEPAFNSLHADSRWSKVMALIKSNNAAAETGLDKNLVSILDTILHDDQSDRNKGREIRARYGAESEAVRSLTKTIAAKDAVNLKKVRIILDKYGWPDPAVIGNIGEITIFLVIQHAPVDAQKEMKPQIDEAYHKGYIDVNWYATFLDKIAVNEGKEQLYGTQVQIDTQTGKYYVLPLQDPEHVDERRAKMGLNSMTEYLKFYNIEWSVEEYKKRSGR